MRSLHPDAAHVAAADSANQALSEKVAALNSSRALYDAVRAADGGSNAQARHLQRVALHDFRMGGMHLPTAGEREKAAALMLQADVTMTEFVRGCGAEGEAASDARVGRVVDEALGHSRDSSPTERANATRYVRRYTHSSSNGEVLAQLLDTRHELARTLGFASYADAEAAAGSNLRTFAAASELDAWLQGVAEQAGRGAAQEKETVRRAFGLGADARMAPWDWSHYKRAIQSSKWLSGEMSQAIAPYMTVGRVMHGLARLTDQLFGLELRPVPVGEAEVWDGHVRKMELWGEGGAENGLVGTIYLDMFSRPAAFASAGTFSVWCGRGEGPHDPDFSTSAVVLNMNVAQRSRSGDVAASLLTDHEASDLVHEYGHSLNL